MEKFPFTANKAVGLSFQLPTDYKGAFNVVGSFVRRSLGVGKGMTKADDISLTDKDAVVFLVLDFGDDQPRSIQLNTLNAIDTFSSAIDVDGDTFSVKDGAQITISGKTIAFSMN